MAQPGTGVINPEAGMQSEAFHAAAFAQQAPRSDIAPPTGAALGGARSEEQRNMALATQQTDDGMGLGMDPSAAAAYQAQGINPYAAPVAAAFPQPIPQAPQAQPGFPQMPQPGAPQAPASPSPEQVASEQFLFGQPMTQPQAPAQPQYPPVSQLPQYQPSQAQPYYQQPAPQQVPQPAPVPDDDFARREQELEERETALEQQDQSLAGAAELLRNDVLRGNAALGNSPDVLMAALQRSGHLAGPNGNNGNGQPQPVDLRMPALPDEADPFTKALYQQNQALANHVQQTQQKVDALEVAHQQSTQQARDYAAYNERSGRVNDAVTTVKTAARELQRKGGALAGGQGKMLIDLAARRIAENIDSAPYDEAGLSKWSAKQFRSVASEYGMGTRRRPRGPASVQSQIRTGQVLPPAAPPMAQQQYQQPYQQPMGPPQMQQQQPAFDFEDDNQRQSAAIQWMAARAQGLGMPFPQ